MKMKCSTELSLGPFAVGRTRIRMECSTELSPWPFIPGAWLDVGWDGVGWGGGGVDYVRGEDTESLYLF